MLTDREKALLDENRTLRRLLRSVWVRTHAENYRADREDDEWQRVRLTVGELREIAALFAEGEDDN